jgi:ssDNA-binding Zn-finger/Zn-ribbon topoisomerase 1
MATKKTATKKKPAAKKKPAPKKKPAAKKKTAAKKTAINRKTATTKATATKKKTTTRKKASSSRMQQILAEHEAIYGKGYFEPTNVKCPLCGKGVIVPKRGRFGAEWRCNADTKPKCKFMVQTKPTGKKCTYKRDGKRCGALMVAGTKTIPDRCSDRSCPNRNPHKL